VIIEPDGGWLQGDVYIDGSALDGPVGKLNRCGWAFGILDDEFQPDYIAWMPAHKSQCQIGKVLKSNGEAMTALDWMANRAVDELAKSAANSVRVPQAALNRLKAVEDLATFWRTRLGRVTYASQNHLCSVLGDDGFMRTVRKRDADGKPQTSNRRDTRDPEPQRRVTPAFATTAEPPPPANEPEAPANFTSSKSSQRAKPYSTMPAGKQRLLPIQESTPLERQRNSPPSSQRPPTSWRP
jgi:hypothetical protein